MLPLDSSSTLRSLTVWRHVLHWLDVSDRIKFRLCVTVYEPVHGMAPGYLSELCRPVSALRGRRHLRSAGHGHLDIKLVSDVPLMESGRLSMLAHLLGTHYLMM